MSWFKICHFEKEGGGCLILWVGEVKRSSLYYLLTLAVPTMYFIGRVTLFFANNFLTEYRNTMEF